MFTKLSTPQVDNIVNLYKNNPSTKIFSDVSSTSKWLKLRPKLCICLIIIIIYHLQIVLSLWINPLFYFWKQRQFWDPLLFQISTEKIFSDLSITLNPMDFLHLLIPLLLCRCKSRFVPIHPWSPKGLDEASLSLQVAGLSLQ